MRASTDMPRRRRRGSNRGRIALIVAAVALFLFVTSLRGIAGFYTDFLWFDSLDFDGVFWGTLRAQIGLVVVFTGAFFVLLYVNLLIADRVAPKFRPTGPEDDLLERYHDVVAPRQNLVRFVVAFVIALFFGFPAAGHWQEWLLWSNSVPFGVDDPQFGTDVSFYIFRLPFYTYIVDWLFGALIFVLIMTTVAHYLNGGIRLQSQLQRVSPQVKKHLSVLLGLIALVKAVDYWLKQYELTLSTRGIIDGAGYTAVNAELPALRLLMLISLAAFVVFILNIWRRGWVLPVVTIVLWLFAAVTAGALYPALVQRFQVEPAESSKEQPYIERNIEATRQALALNSVNTETFEYEEALNTDQLLSNSQTISNIRLLDPNQIQDTYKRLQEQHTFYEFRELDIDRYTIENDDGTEETTQVVLGARELNIEGIPQKSWEGQHVAYTHGYGLALAPSNQPTADGRPDFLIRNVPVEVDDRLPASAAELDQPGIYIGDGLGGYAIVNTDRVEIDYPDAEGDPVPVEEIPNGGVGASGTGFGGFVRRAAFALRFGEIEPLISSFITADSRAFYIRDVRERVAKVAPFLSLDADPYPVVTDEGDVKYIVDAYTTSSDYPYGELADNEQLPPATGLDHDFNYVRNSVKVVVDAYTGDLTLYMMPGVENADGERVQDPIVRAWSKAFPDLFTDFDEMPDALKEHIRYPEDLFRVQTNMWGRYHLDDPTEWYQNSGGWAVAQNPGASVEGEQTTTSIDPQGNVVEGREARIDPYYLQMQLPGADEATFELLRPFVPVSEGDSQKVLTAFMTASSDGEDYGRLNVYELDQSDVDGPAIVQASIQSSDTISQELSLLDQQGSTVTFGNLLLVPVDQAILYVRPLYVQASGNTAVPQLRKVIVAFGEEVTMGDTLLDAMEQIFTGEDEQAALAEILSEDLELPTDPDEGPDETPEDDQPAPAETVEELLAEADSLLQEAEQALADGDLGTYQDRVDDARAKVTEALGLAGGQPADGGAADGDTGDDGGGGDGGGGETPAADEPDTA